LQALGSVSTPTPAPLDAHSAVQKYVTRLESDMTSGAPYLTTLASTSKQVSSNRSLLLDPTWNRSMNDALNGLRATVIRLRSYSDVPVAAVSLNAEVASIGEDMIFIADTTGKGVEDLDPSLLDQAGQRLNAMTAKLTAASKDDIALKRQFGLP
jgi:hypothetical protein